jgi:hypothetical protein
MNSVLENTSRRNSVKADPVKLSDEESEEEPKSCV